MQPKPIFEVELEQEVTTSKSKEETEVPVARPTTAPEITKGKSEEQQETPASEPMIEPEASTSEPKEETEVPVARPTKAPETSTGKSEEQQEMPTSKPVMEQEIATSKPEAKQTATPSVPEVEAPKQTPTMPTEAPVQITVPPAIHVHNVTLEKQEATCLEAGVEREYCKLCKEMLTERTLDPLGHDFVKSVWELPTCQKGGYYNDICSRCGLVVCVSQEPLPHETEDVVIQEGNCMEDTVIQHICRVCGMETLEETRYTLYDVHNWVTTMVDGAQITYCERCGISQ